MRETSVWKGNVPNHTYVLDDSMTKMLAYIKQGTKEVIKFDKPLSFDRKDRTFVEIKAQAKKDHKTVQVAGSKGAVYNLTEVDGVWSCTCPGYHYRSSCRHIKEHLLK